MADEHHTQYPFPLSDGRFAYIHLPAGFTRDDVDRLTQFLHSLPLDPPGSTPPGETP